MNNVNGDLLQSQGHCLEYHPRPDSKEYTFQLPSGRKIPIPNFYETLEPQKRALAERFAKQVYLHFDPVGFEFTFHPPIKLDVINRDKGEINSPRNNATVDGRSADFHCDVFTGKWRNMRHGRPQCNIDCLKTLLLKENALTYRQLMDQDREIKRLAAFVDHIRERKSSIDELMQLVQDSTSHTETQTAPE